MRPGVAPEYSGTRFGSQVCFFAQSMQPAKVFFLDNRDVWARIGSVRLSDVCTSVGAAKSLVITGGVVWHYEYRGSVLVWCLTTYH